MTHFPLLGKDKFPLGVEYIFESKFPLVVRIGLAARACGSGNGQSPSNSAESTSKTQAEQTNKEVESTSDTQAEQTIKEVEDTSYILVYPG